MVEPLACKRYNLFLLSLQSPLTTLIDISFESIAALTRSFSFSIGVILSGHPGMVGFDSSKQALLVSLVTEGALYGLE